MNPKVFIHLVNLEANLVRLHLLLHNDTHHHTGVSCAYAYHANRVMLSNGMRTCILLCIEVSCGHRVACSSCVLIYRLTVLDVNRGRRAEF